MTSTLLPGSAKSARRSVRSTLSEAWRMRRVWWFTATARTRARFVRTYFGSFWLGPVSYTHLRAHETSLHLVCRLLLEKKK